MDRVEKKVQEFMSRRLGRYTQKVEMAEKLDSHSKVFFSFSQSKTHTHTHTYTLTHRFQIAFTGSSYFVLSVVSLFCSLLGLVLFSVPGKLSFMIIKGGFGECIGMIDWDLFQFIANGLVACCLIF